MNFDLTDEQRMLQAAAKEMLAARLKPEKIRALAETADALDEQLWQEIVELGWTGLTVPEEYGGQGLGMVELVVLLEQAGYALLPGPFLSNTLTAIVIDAGAPDSIKQAYLAPIAAGEKRGTMAYWEPGRGGTPEQIELDPQASGGAITLNTEKLFVFDATTADFFVVGGANGRRFIVDSDAPGITITALPAMDDTRKQYSVKFDGVQVDAAMEFEFDPTTLERTWARLVTAFAAESVGIAQQAMEMAVEYAKQRKQFDRPIGAYQAISHSCAKMLMETEGARSATYYAAWTAENEPETSPLAAAMAKAYASDAACDVTGSSLQVHGGIGFTWEHDLHLWLKRARTNAALFGDANWQRERVAQLAVDQVAEPLPA